MTWKADELPSKLDGLLDRRIAGVEAGFPDMLVRQPVVLASPYGFGEGGDHVWRQPHCFADFADRPARAVVNDSRADGSTMPAIALINVLDYLLAPFVFEIDIDIGRFVALLRDKTGKQKLAFVWIDLGYAKAVADGT